MDANMPRRTFLKTAPAAVGLLHLSSRAVPIAALAPEVRLHPLDSRGTQLLDSR